MGRGSEPDLRVAALSRKQHGVWSREQAVRRGMTPTMIRARVRSGEWVRLDHGVYGHVAVPPTWERSLMAAVLAEPWAAVSHRAAAVLHELTGYRPGRPEITIRPNANARGRLAIAHRGVDVRTTTVRGIPTVTVAQAIVDLSQLSSEAKVATALSDRAASSPHLLDAVRDRYCELAPRGGRNLRTLASILERFGAGAAVERSVLEQQLVQVLTGRGIPPVVWEAPFPGRSPGSQRVDGLIEDWRLVVEGDGRTWHERVEDFERDRRRDAEAAAAGYLTLRFTYHQLTVEQRWVRRIVLETGARRAVDLRGPRALPRLPGAPNPQAA
jgi:hypothetical protein